ncbi:hypothetical protein O181_060440 [Austropuccinia psidii MF-1]|uniref:Chromo domain-containing protein n=1 Tax=Austropuccinia psidii MF-1 TaxID=1389203 RepID=A0A9Q3EDC7_9BASI|nr:hypothetical protein [Austropuccinia psidii MF-1]
MEYKDHEGYTHDWVTLLPAVQLAYNTSQNSTIGNTPAQVEKGWNHLLPVDNLKKNLLTIHPPAKDLHEMWKRACNTASKCIAEAKEYNKQRWDKSHMESDFKKEDQGKNAVEVKLTEEFLRKHPVFPVSLVKPYFQTEEDKFISRKKNPTTTEIVEVEDSLGLVKKIIKARKIRLNGKDQRQYLVRFKSQKADKDKWLAEDAIPDGNLHLRKFRASRRTEQSHQSCAFFRGRVCHPVTQNQSISMTAKYHTPMVKPRYHQKMELSQISSKGIKRKWKPTNFQIHQSHHHRTRNNKVVAEHKP